MLQQMQHQEDEEKAQNEKTDGQASKREQNAEKAAAESQRRATRGSEANGVSTSDAKADKAPKRRVEEGQRGKIQALRTTSRRKI